MDDLTKSTDVTLATRLHGIEKLKANLEAEEKQIRTTLLERLQKQGVKHIRLDDGTTYTRSFKTTLKAKDKEKALVWATKNNALSVDTKKAREILRRQLKLPTFFKLEKGKEFLQVRRPGELEDNEE